jgi:hypothetical protein
MLQNGKQIQSKPTIYWILQENHVSPFIIDFLKFFKSGTPNINLKFLIPSLWENLIKATQALEPDSFDVVTQTEDNYEWFRRKREAIKDVKFEGGLNVWRALLQDDLHSGLVHLYDPRLPLDPALKFILMQIPSPLGSYEHEEKIFHGCIHWARSNNIRVIGYELLPFDTKWNLPHTLVDGIITTKERSYDWLTSDRVKINKKVWLLPRYEAQFFSGSSSHFWRNGLGVPYTNQHRLNIPHEKTILYIPHNVAMSYEYKILIKELGKFGDHLHIKISIGKDQVRGSHTHQEIVELLNRDDLKKFHSYTFCDLNKPEELVDADAVVACSNCHLSEIAASKAIPSLILDPDVAPGRYGHTTIVCHFGDLYTELSKIIESHKKTSKLGDIFFQLLNTPLNRLKTKKANDETHF